MSVDLDGPYGLTFDGIAGSVVHRRCGVYALGFVDRTGVFRVERVGRDEVDIRAGLEKLIGTTNYFKVATARSGLEAFLIECELYHRFRPTGNFIHPVRAQCSVWMCPYCR